MPEQQPLLFDEAEVEAAAPVAPEPALETITYRRRKARGRREALLQEFPVLLFEYQRTRSGDHPRKFLSGFAGYLHVDGYFG